MDKKLDFRFEIQKPPPGPLVEISGGELERALLKRLENEKAQPVEALWQLARFYQQSKQPEKGLSCLRQALEHMPDPERKANCVLGMGQMMEAAHDYEAAIRFYKEAFALEPVQTDVWYFINNNLGFCLNTLGNFVEGEKYCRKAVEINPNRPNAYKNLGIALAGQADYRGAGRCYVAATHANAADPRASQLLQYLIRQHPELEYEFQEELVACRQAVQVVSQKAEQLKPVVYRGWRKHLILLRGKIRTIGNRLLKMFSR